MDTIKEALTFDDVLLLPRFSSVLPSKTNFNIPYELFREKHNIKADKNEITNKDNDYFQKESLNADNIDLWEINEAFAVVPMAAIEKFNLNNEKVNVNGGAIALGHPIGASGSRIIVTLIHEMNKREAKKGLGTLCIGGGMGIAMCIERD